MNVRVQDYQIFIAYNIYGEKMAGEINMLNYMNEPRHKMTNKEERCPYLRKDGRCNIAKSARCLEMRYCAIKHKIRKGLTKF